MGGQPITAVVVGAGHRSIEYAGYSLLHPDELQIVGIAEPNPLRRQQIAETYNLSPAQCFESAEALAKGPRIADAVINGTMDHQHVATSLPLLAAGYDILLEKPFATSEEEMWRLVKACRKHKRKIIVCHLLRYTPFYRTIRERLLNGEIGEVINIQTIEHVSYHHMAVGYVRGKWNRKDYCQSTMLLAKCCHDLDLIAWMKSGVAPIAVASFGSNMQFREEKAPAQAGTRCLVDCPIESDCLYSARKHYIDHPERWGAYVWACIEHIPNPTIEDKIQSLKTDNPFGRCVWRCDNDVVDHQSVMVEFEDGSTATHNLVGGTARPMRSIHLVGTKGEIQGVLEDNRFVIRHIDLRPGHEYSEEWVDVNSEGDLHGAFGSHGGSEALFMTDFLSMLRGEPLSISCTNIENSINGHLIIYLADRAREKQRVVCIPRNHGALPPEG